MVSRPSAKTGARLLTATALLLALLSSGGTCTSNAGRIFDPGFDSGGGGDGGGGGTTGEIAAPVQGSFLKAGPPALLRMAPAPSSAGVDVRAVVVLWFSESLNFTTLSPTTLGLRVQGGSDVAHSRLSFAADRCIALVPAASLATDTVYEVFATTAVSDLDGAALSIPAGGVLGTFHTATAATGVPPRVLGSFPPGGTGANPNDYPVIVAFSKPVDFTTVSGATTLVNTTTSAAGDYGAPVSHAGGRIVEFPHLGAASDLGATMTLSVATTITDTEFVPLALAAPFAASWSTLAFGPPTAIDTLGVPAVNLGNASAFSSEVTVPASVLASDVVSFRVYSAGGGSVVQNALPTSVALPVFSFTTSLLGSGGANLLPDGSLVLAAFVQRGAFRSTVFVMSGRFSQDTVRPVLQSFGPPAGSIPSRFVTAVPELRPYGEASETITAVDAEFPVSSGFTTRTVPAGDPGGFFMGPAFPLGSIQEGPLPFKLALTDAAGNPMNPGNTGLDAEVVFRGFVTGGPLLNSSLRVVAFNADTLQPVTGATVYLEDHPGGGNAAALLTQSDGSAVFPGRTGPQRLTVVHPSFFAASLIGSDADLVSLPLRPSVRASGVVSPVVTGASSGSILLAAHTLRDLFGDDRPDGLLDELLPLPFGGVNVRPLQPPWFAAFHEVAAFGGDPVTGRYFERLGADLNRILPPSASGGSAVQALVALVPSTNALLGSTDYLYNMSLGAGAGFDLPPSETSVAGLVVIPGLAGPAAVGAGALADPPVAAEVEVEIGLHGLAATEEGAAAGTVILQVYAADAFGDQALARSPQPLAASPPGDIPVTLPDIPVSPPQASPQTYPPLLAFTPSLGGGDGFYLLVLQDSAGFPAQWDLWIPASVGAGGSVTLPGLGGSGNAPLLLGSWTLFCEAFGMPASFSEAGFFFSSLRRDNLSWARSIPGPPFTVNP